MQVKECLHMGNVVEYNIQHFPRRNDRVEKENGTVGFTQVTCQVHTLQLYSGAAQTTCT